MVNGSAVAVLAIALGVLVNVASPAYAASCSAHGSGSDPLLSGSPGDLDTSDMTFRGGQADGCSGLYKGNNSAAEVGIVAAQLGSVLDPLQPEIKADGAGTTAAAAYGGIQWTLSYQTGPDPNAWTLSYSAHPDVVKSYDVIAALKQATGWAVFRFAGEVFATDGTGGGTFFIDWCKGSQNMSFDCSSDGLSHLSIYLVSSAQEIPLPASLPLLLAGLAGLVLRLRWRWMSRRRTMMVLTRMLKAPGSTPRVKRLYRDITLLRCCNTSLSRRWICFRSTVQ